MADKIKCTGTEDLGDFNDLLELNLARAQEDPEYVASLTKPRQGNPITLGPRVMAATEWADDMVAGATAKSKKWLDHATKPKKDPKERALKAAKKYENNMRAALDEKRWDDGIKGYDEALRQTTLEAVGESGYREGISRKKAKITARVAKLQPLVGALADTLDRMPVDTPEQRAAKMVAARDGMLAIKKQMRK